MRATHHATVAILVMLVSASVVAQQAQSSDAASSTAPPEFEVASIKLNTDARQPFNVVDRTFMRLTASGASNGRYTMGGFGAPAVSVLIQAAHQVKEF
jgi:hypothetical protein